MGRKFFLFGRPSKPTGSGQVDLSSRTEERLNTEFASLRRLADGPNLLTLEQAIDRARDAAEVYRRWQKSGASIRDIVLRLSNGSEIKIDKATPDDTNRFGFRFSSKFPRGAALDFYKRADREFGEVLLYSVELDRIQQSGHSYAKTYENGQTMMLAIEPGLSGQFNVSVDYTMPSDAVDFAPSRRERVLERLPGLAKAAALCLMAALVFMAAQKMYLTDAPVGEAAPGTPAEGDPLTTNPAVPPQAAVDEQARRDSPAGTNDEEKSERPGPQPEYQQSESPAPDAATPPVDRQRKAPDAAVEARASIRMPNDVEQPQQEPSRPPDAALGDAKSSGLNGKKEIVGSGFYSAWPLDKENWDTKVFNEVPVAEREHGATDSTGGTDSTPKRQSHRADPPVAPGGNTQSSTGGGGKNKIPIVQ